MAAHAFAVTIFPGHDERNPCGGESDTAVSTDFWVDCEMCIRDSNLPLIYTTVERKFAAELSGHLIGTLFPIDLYMIKPWELSEEKGGHFAWLLEK